jgi:DNA-binding MarR family transcriptional regulator
MADHDTAWLAPDELAAWVSLIKLSARIVSLSDGELRRRHGITGRDYELLHHLSADDDGRRVTDLAEVIDDTSSCITHRVNRLVDAGLVAKRTDPHDRRSRLVVLTPRGRSLLQEAAPGHVERVRRWVIDPLSRRDLGDLTRVSRKLGDHLRTIEPPNP